MENSEIIELYWTRQERAIAETQRKYGAYCYAIANNLLGDPQDAEECVNDAYLRVWNSIPPTRPNDLRLFLARITRNLSIDRLRARKAAKRDATVVSFDELENTLYRGEDVFSEQQSVEALQAAIDRYLRRLSERDRNVFIRRYWFCEDIPTIARKYGLGENLVSKILSRARIGLRQSLKKEGLYQ